MTAASGRGWWRRNWWGLLAVLPLLVAAVALSPNDSYQLWRTAQPREAVGPDRDGWVDYGGTRLRLDAVAPADLRDDTGEPYPLPGGLRAWQATVTFGRIADPDKSLLGCAFQLEDDAGRRFGDHPTELGDAELAGVGFTSPTICRPDEEGAETFEAIALFLLPASATPAALLLTASDQLPAYARFELDPATLPAE